ncbi:MAG: metallophosphoesterase family protein [Candidatus Omnitrophota bacterium]
MRLGVFSDVHSNLEALEAVLDAYKTEEIDIYFCIGDIVGYGANPVECTKIIQEIARISVAGNHDQAAVGLFSLDYFNEWAKQALLWTQKKIDEDSRNFLAALRLVYENDFLTLVHGNLNAPAEFDCLADIFQAAETFRLMKRQVCFIGHTHKCGVFVQDKNGRVDYKREMRINIQEESRYIVNVGSVGQPRDGDNKASYCVYDTIKQGISLKRVGYDIKTAQAKIIAAGLPRFLSTRLSIGR